MVLASSVPAAAAASALHMVVHRCGKKAAAASALHMVVHRCGKKVRTITWSNMEATPNADKINDAMTNFRLLGGSSESGSITPITLEYTDRK